MKRLLVVAACLFLIGACKKKDVATIGVKTAYDSGFYTLPGTLAFSNSTAVKTRDNDIVVCGMNGTQALLVKLTTKGTVVWHRTFFVDPGAEVASIAELPQGGYAIAGGDANSSFVIVTNASGQKLWKNYYGDSAITIASQLTTTTDGEIILAGSMYKDSSRTAANIYLSKIKTNGAQVWEKTFASPLAAGYSVLTSPTGEILVTGAFAPNGYGQGTYLLKTTATGDKLWERTPSATEKAVGISSRLLANGELITLGATHAAGYDGITVFKFNAEGNKIWEKELTGSSRHLHSVALHTNNDGSIVIAGYIQDAADVASTDILLVKLDASGNTIWQKALGGSDEDRAYNIIADAGALLLIGNTKSYGEKKGEPNIFILRVNDAGDVIY